MHQKRLFSTVVIFRRSHALGIVGAERDIRCAGIVIDPDFYRRKLLRRGPDDQVALVSCEEGFDRCREDPGRDLMRMPMPRTFRQSYCCQRLFACPPDVSMASSKILSGREDIPVDVHPAVVLGRTRPSGLDPIPTGRG